MFDDDYKNGNKYTLTAGEEDAWQEESYQEGLISDLSNSIKNDDYPIDTIVQGLQTAFNERGYAIQFFLQSDQYKKHEGLTDD